MIVSHFQSTGGDLSSWFSLNLTQSNKADAFTAVKLNFAVAASCQVNQLSSFFMTVAVITELKLKVLCYPNTDTDSGLKINFYKLLIDMKVTLYCVPSLLFLLSCSK